MNAETQKFYLQRADDLPMESDFNPWGSADARNAWKNFGNKSISQAYQKFKACPEGYCEDFMSMGPKAFGYYFAVIDKHFKTISVTDDIESEDGCDLEIWGDVLDLQLTAKGVWHSPMTITELSALCEYVTGNLIQYSSIKKTQLKINEKWRMVKNKLAKYPSHPKNSKRLIGFVSAQ